MEESKVIEMLLAQLAEAREEIKTLHEIIKNYSKQETKVINDIKVNSYNGSNAEAVGTQTDIEKAKNVNTGTAHEIGDKTNRI